jgi:RIP metalloprotease RseP
MDSFISLFSSCKSIILTILFFGGSIFFHELGHFLAARRRGLFIPRFSMGFGPRIFSKTIGETEFCISLLPLGGYVALPQLMEAKGLEGEYRIPMTARAITPADKIIVSAMGAIFNIIFAFILATILWITGMERPQSTVNSIVGYVCPEIKLPSGEKVISPAKAAGIEIGDEIVAVDGHETHNFSDIIHGIALGTNRDSIGPLSELTIRRGLETKQLALHPMLISQNAHSKESVRIIGIETFQELVIDSIYANSPAERGGLRVGDRLCAIDGGRLFSYSQMEDLLKNAKSVALTVERGGEQITTTLEPQSIPFIRPHIKLATDAGEVELFPSFSDQTVTGDLYKDVSVLKILSLSSEFQKRHPNLAIGDRITAIQRRNIPTLSDALFTCQNSLEIPINFTVNDQTISLVIKSAELVPEETHPSLGMELRGTRVLCHENPFKQIKEGTYLVFATLGSLISPSSDVHFKNLMGPPGIIKTMNTFASYNFPFLLWFVIMLNVNLAVFNLLPIPILDGGILALVFLELLLRKKIPLKIVASMQFAFMLFFIGLVLYISFFDVHRMINENEEEKHYLKRQYLFLDEQWLWNGFSGHPS